MSDDELLLAIKSHPDFLEAPQGKDCHEANWAGEYICLEPACGMMYFWDIAPTSGNLPWLCQKHLLEDVRLSAYMKEFAEAVKVVA